MINKVIALYCIWDFQEWAILLKWYLRVPAPCYYLFTSLPAIDRDISLDFKTLHNWMVYKQKEIPLWIHRIAMNTRIWYQSNRVFQTTEKWEKIDKRNYTEETNWRTDGQTDIQNDKWSINKWFFHLDLTSYMYLFISRYPHCHGKKRDQSYLR